MVLNSLTVSKKRRIRECLKRAFQEAEEHFMSMTSVAWGRWIEFTHDEKERQERHLGILVTTENVSKLVELLQASVPGERSSAELQPIMDYLKLLKFPPTNHVEGASLEAFSMKAKVQDFEEKEVIFREGDVDRTMYTVLKGKVAISKLQKTQKSRSNSLESSHYSVYDESSQIIDEVQEFGTVVKLCHMGDAFGEQNILKVSSKKPEREETAWCVETTTLLVITRSLYIATCVSPSHWKMEFLRSIKWCKNWPEWEIANLAADLTKICFPAQVSILKKGDSCDFIYLIEKGDISLIEEIQGKNGAVIPVQLCHASTGMMIADSEAYEGIKTSKYNVFANTDAHLYKLTYMGYRKHFLSKDYMKTELEDSVNSRKSLYTKKIQDKIKRYVAHRRSTEMSEKINLIKYGALRKRASVMFVQPEALVLSPLQPTTQRPNTATGIYDNGPQTDLFRQVTEKKVTVEKTEEILFVEPVDDQLAPLQNQTQPGSPYLSEQVDALREIRQSGLSDLDDLFISKEEFPSLLKEKSMEIIPRLGADRMNRLTSFTDTALPSARLGNLTRQTSLNDAPLPSARPASSARPLSSARMHEKVLQRTPSKRMVRMGSEVSGWKTDTSRLLTGRREIITSLDTQR